MKRSSLILTLLLTVQLLLGCSGNIANSNTGNSEPNTNSRANAAPTANDSAEELGMIVRLPAQPEEVAWREENDGKLLAVMRFEPTDANRIGDEALKVKPAVPGSIDAEDWFPKELISQSEMAEDSKLKGQEFAGDIMLQTPYSRGRLLRIENTDFYVLEAFKQ